ncbi:MAG: hypothetical protein OHK0052_26840 [Anaerolineales bacterium]
MGIVSLVFGILTFLGVCLSLIPFLNILNCFTLPVALIGLLLGIADLLANKEKEGSKGVAIAGVVLCSIALLLGGGRALLSLVTTGGIL